MNQSTCTHCQQPIERVGGFWLHVNPASPVSVSDHPAVPSQLSPAGSLPRLRLLAASGVGLAGDVLLSDLGGLLERYDRLREFAVHSPSCRRVAGRGDCSCGLDEVLSEV